MHNSYVAKAPYGEYRVELTPSNVWIAYYLSMGDGIRMLSARTEFKATKKSCENLCQYDLENELEGYLS